MYIHLSETTLKTILGTILKNSVENFSLYTLFSYLQLILTSVIDLFKTNGVKLYVHRQVKTVSQFVKG